MMGTTGELTFLFIYLFLSTIERPESPTLPMESSAANNGTPLYSVAEIPMPRASTTSSAPTIAIQQPIHTTKQRSASSRRAKKKKPEVSRLPSPSTTLQLVPEMDEKPDNAWMDDYQPPAPASGMYWSRYKKNLPHALRGHTASLVGDLLYVFGGANQATCYDRLYIMDMDTLMWRSPNTIGKAPSPSRGHSANIVEYQTGTRKSFEMFVFGGGDGPRYFNDVYRLNTESLSWSQPKVQGKACSPRRAHITCVWKTKIIVVGGGDGSHPLADVHVLDVADKENVVWEKWAPTGDAPLARGYHSGNLVGHKLVIFGGSDGQECFGDVYVLDLETREWTFMPLNQCIPRFGHTATQVGSYLFIIGGHDGSSYSNQVLVLNLVTMAWEARHIYGVAPPARGYHTSVLYDSRIYVLGGYNSKRVFDDLAILELSSYAYLPQITNFSIDLTADQD
ncbi:hypothetical protein BC940DRAFT_305274 [Gongronella butleri]|nr:hypothetical protein BC940DRAFT_305274 [Gongronella butleri]